MSREGAVWLFEMGTEKQGAGLECPPRVGDPEFVILIAMLALVGLAMSSLLAGRLWQRLLARNFEVIARTQLVRQLGFQAIGRRAMAARVNGVDAEVIFGHPNDPLQISAAAAPQRSRAVALDAQTTATIELACPADLPVDRLSVEMSCPVAIRGRRDFAFALLELPLRSVLHRGERAEWIDNRFRIVTRHPRDGGDFANLVEKAVAVAATLMSSQGNDVERRLVDEALFCRAPESRLRALQLLVDHYDSPLTKSALVRLAGDADPIVQLHAAKALGSEGFEKLRALARNSRAPTPLRAQAVEIVAEGGDPHANGLMKRLIDDGCPSIARLAVRHLGIRAGLSAMGEIRGVILRPNANENVVLAGIEYLERMGFQHGADALHQLSSHRSERVQSAAFDVIGRHGDLSWLLVLKTRLQHAGLSNRLARTVQNAILRIRTRHQAGAGRLSLSPSSSGVPLGALSRPPPPLIRRDDAVGPH